MALLSVAACGPVTDRQATELKVGYDTLDGSLPVWPARGSLAGDAGATSGISRAVRAWRSPVDNGVHIGSSGILWSGTVDGAPLALVAANVPGESASWLLQLTSGGDGWTVSHAVEYTDPGYLAYSDVLPVRQPAGSRYLTSARVERMTGPDGAVLATTDGLTDPVRLSACTAVPLTASLRATTSLPTGRPVDRLIDLGTGIQGPRYPLVRDDEGGTGQAALTGLDTCALAGEESAFGSVPRRFADREVPKAVPMSWPIGEITRTDLGEITTDGVRPGRLEQLTWASQGGRMTAVVYRPTGGATPVVSPADRVNELQVYPLEVSGHPLVAVTWRPGPDSNLAVPAELPRLVNRPGLVVVPAPEKSATVSLTELDDLVERSVQAPRR